nr:MAG TPA: Structural protein sp46 [Caudoviricetes sp.]
MNNAGFLALESANETPVIGSFKLADQPNSFDANFENAVNLMKESYNVDPLLDLNTMIKNKTVMGAYKDAVLSGLMNEHVADPYGDAGADMRFEATRDQISALWDNCVEDLVKESASVGALLPFKAVDLPILVKQHLSMVGKEIIDCEVVNTPIIKRHYEQTYLKDNTTGKLYEYPQCMFRDEYAEIFGAGKGLKIPEDAITLPAYEKSVIEMVTGAVPGKDTYTLDLKISKVTDVNGDEYVLDQPMRIAPNDHTWLGGNLRLKAKSTGEGLTKDEEFTDLITGMANQGAGTISLTSCNGKIKSVKLDGYLSGEYNERHVGIEYARKEFEWKIEDGFRMLISYSLEELEDAKALMSIDLYKKTYTNLSDTLVQVEDMGILTYLDEMYDKYNGIEVDGMDLVSWTQERTFSCDHTAVSGVMQSDFIYQMLKFNIDRMIIGMADKFKCEDLTFVIYGNPKYVSLLGDNVKWTMSNGDTRAGVKANYAYGVMTTGGVKVRVVSTNKVNWAGLRIIPYPISEEMMTFKHWKYTTHIMTTANSGYKDPARPGGAMSTLMGTIRCQNGAIQGVQGKINFTDANFI